MKFAKLLNKVYLKRDSEIDNILNGEKVLPFAQFSGEFKPEIAYTLVHNKIPNDLEFACIDTPMFLKRFGRKYKEEFRHVFYHFDLRGEAVSGRWLMIFLNTDIALVVNQFCRQVTIYQGGGNTDKIDGLIKLITACKEEEKDLKLSIITLEDQEFCLKAVKVNKPILSIEHNYNDDFAEVHSAISKGLGEKDSKGLILLHGKPGTGKTTYLRYLCNSLKKRVIFLPQQMASNLVDPFFIQFLFRNGNSILVIEDAERVITGRASDPNSPVSALLNLCDGLLSDSLNIQIIATFNCDLSSVDEALLRKGRLIARYEFAELSLDKTRQLAEKLEHDVLPETPLCLTDIYNRAPVAGSWKKKSVLGFAQ